MTNQSHGMLPFEQCNERFGEDVCGLELCLAVDHFEESFLKTFMQPSQINSVGSVHVTHCRVLSRFDHSDCGGIVFLKLDDQGSSEYPFP